MSIEYLTVFLICLVPILALIPKEIWAILLYLATLGLLVLGALVAVVLWAESV